MLADTYFPHSFPGSIPEPAASTPWLFEDGMVGSDVSSIQPGLLVFQTAHAVRPPSGGLAQSDLSDWFSPADQRPPGFSSDILSILQRYFGQGNRDQGSDVKFASSSGEGAVQGAG